MTLIVCLDSADGMMFSSRRQSKDRVLRKKMLTLTEGKPLWMSTYSARQFEEAGHFVADDAYAQNAPSEAFCFVEDGPLPMENAEQLVIYRWNRAYPADRYFPTDVLTASYRLVADEEFVGSSHEKITQEIYIRKEEDAS